MHSKNALYIRLSSVFNPVLVLTRVFVNQIEFMHTELRKGWGYAIQRDETKHI